MPLEVCRAVSCVGPYCGYSVLIAYLFALERLCAIGVTKLHTACLSGCKSGLGALAD